MRAILLLLLLSLSLLLLSLSLLLLLSLSLSLSLLLLLLYFTWHQIYRHETTTCGNVEQQIHSSVCSTEQRRRETMFCVSELYLVSVQRVLNPNMAEYIITLPSGTPLLAQFQGGGRFVVYQGFRAASYKMTDSRFSGEKTNVDLMMRKHFDCPVIESDDLNVARVQMPERGSGTDAWTCARVQMPERALGYRCLNVRSGTVTEYFLCVGQSFSFLFLRLCFVHFVNIWTKKSNRKNIGCWFSSRGCSWDNVLMRISLYLIY